MRLALTADRALFGRADECNLLSHDPAVAERHATIRLESGGARIRALASDGIYVDGQPTTDVLLMPGQQVRLGRSVWQLAVPGATHVSLVGLVERVGDSLVSYAGVEKPRASQARSMFSDVMTRRTDEEIEEYFTVGTPITTPPLASVDASWPKPWVFFRVFALALVLYFVFVWAWSTFENVYLIPGLIMTGSVAIPFALLVLFFEVNVPRNISLYQVIKLLLIAGLLSIIISLIGFRATGLASWLGAASAGIIEETGKALALLIVINRPRYRWTLNGLLLGAAVGTGFAVFESAGYALDAAVSTGTDAMRGVIMERGLLSILGGHTLWTGLVGAALWRVRGDRPFSREMLADPRFLRVFGLCVLMHMAWNAPIPLPFYAKYLALGFVAWVLVLGFIQDGLQQVRDAQSASATVSTAAPGGDAAAAGVTA